MCGILTGSGIWCLHGLIFKYIIQAVTRATLQYSFNQDCYVIVYDIYLYDIILFQILRIEGGSREEV